MTRHINTNTRKDDWRTARYIFEQLHSEYHFTIDLAASWYNAQLPRYLTEEHDALSQVWAAPERGFCNPPYERPLPWLRKALEACAYGFFSVWVVQANPDTRWFSRYARHGEVHFFDGRIPFEDVTPADIELARMLRVLDEQINERNRTKLAECAWRMEREGKEIPQAAWGWLASFADWRDVGQEAAEKPLPGPGFPSMVVVFDPNAPAGPKPFRMRSAKTGALLP